MGRSLRDYDLATSSILSTGPESVLAFLNHFGAVNPIESTSRVCGTFSGREISQVVPEASLQQDSEVPRSVEYV